MDKDSKGLRKLEDSGGRLLPARGTQHRTEQNRRQQNRLLAHWYCGKASA